MEADHMPKPEVTGLFLERLGVSTVVWRVGFTVDVNGWARFKSRLRCQQDVVALDC